MGCNFRGLRLSRGVAALVRIERNHHSYRDLGALERTGLVVDLRGPRLAFIYHLTDREEIIAILKERKQLRK
jgi:hypothetical protein